MNRAFVYLQQPESRARTTQRTCRSMTLSTSFKCSPIVRLPHPEERLAAGEGDPHPLPDRVRLFARERENVAQEGFDAPVHQAFHATRDLVSAFSSSGLGGARIQAR